MGTYEISIIVTFTIVWIIALTLHGKKKRAAKKEIIEAEIKDMLPEMETLYHSILKFSMDPKRDYRKGHMLLYEHTYNTIVNRYSYEDLDIVKEVLIKLIGYDRVWKRYLTEEQLMWFKYLMKHG